MPTKQAVRVKPLNDHVLVRRSEAEERTKGGIVLPDTAKEKPREGTVVAVGEGKLLDTGKRAPMSLRELDRVLFSSYAGTEVRLEGDDYLLLSEGDILAVIED